MSSIPPPFRDVAAVTSNLLSLLTSILWADGRMAHAQVRALDHVARVLSNEEVASRIVRGPRPYDTTPFVRLEDVARELVYALAFWVAVADRRIHLREQEILRALAESLQVSEAGVERIEIRVRTAQTEFGVSNDGLHQIISELADNRVGRVA